MSSDGEEGSSFHSMSVDGKHETRTLIRHLIAENPEKFGIDRDSMAASSQGSSEELPIFKFSQAVAQRELVKVIIYAALPFDFASNSAFQKLVNTVYDPSARALSPYLFRYNHGVAVTEFAKFACSRSLPLDFAASTVFEEAFKSAFNPEAKKISRKEMLVLIKMLVKETRSVLINDFANISNKVSICSDVWTDLFEYHPQNHYIGITCHWVDDKWVLQKRLIGCKMFVFLENADHVYDIIHEALEEYGLVTKVFSISFDKACADTANFDSLIKACQPSIGAKLFHVRCMSNVLNSCVKDALNTLKDEVGPIREAFHFVFGPTEITKKWVRFCKQNDLTPKVFRPDMPNCWNSTYKMLKDSYEYRDALCSFMTKQNVDIVLSANHWDACSNLCLLLKTFKEVVIELSRVYVSTSVVVLDNCVKIAVLFHSLIGCDGLGACLGGMKVKWLKNFQHIPDMFLVAKLLDPRIRLDGLEELLGIYYDALFPFKDEKTPTPSVIAARAKQCLYDMFTEYSSKNSSDMDSSACSSDLEQTLSVRLQNFYHKRTGKRAANYGSNPRQELESYFTSHFEYLDAESFDVLNWWSRMTTSFPILSMIAKEILAVPALYASSIEQAFGEGGHTFDKSQLRIPLWSVEDYKLLGDWVNAETRNQDIDFEDYSDNDAEIYDDHNTDDDNDNDDDDGGDDDEEYACDE